MPNELLFGISKEGVFNIKPNAFENFCKDFLVTFAKEYAKVKQEQADALKSESD